MQKLSLDPVPILETTDSGLLLFRDNVQLNWDKLNSVINIALDTLNTTVTSIQAAVTSVQAEVDALQIEDLVVPHIASPGNIATDGAGWTSGQRFTLYIVSVVLNFVGGNQNIAFPTAYPNGLGSVVVSHGDGPADTVLNTSNYTKAACGISAINAGAVVNGNLRINYTALGW